MKVCKVIRVYFFLMLTFTGLCAASTEKGDSKIENFSYINEWLARGAQPTEEGLKELKEKGFKTIISFRHDQDAVPVREKEIAEKLGMRFVNIPWRIQYAVDADKVLKDYFEVTDNTASRPIFIHCRHGRDRTGLMSILSGMHYENWSYEESRQKSFAVSRPTWYWYYTGFVNVRKKELFKAYDQYQKSE